MAAIVLAPACQRAAAGVGVGVLIAAQGVRGPGFAILVVGVVADLVVPVAVRSGPPGA